MIINLNRIHLCEETFAYETHINNEDNAEEFKVQIRIYIKFLKDLIETDFEKLDGKKLYQLLIQIYNISLTEEDYLKLLSKKNNRIYDKVFKIATTMTFKDINSVGYKQDSNWWNQRYQIYLTLAIANGINIDEQKIYNKKEIESMLLKKDVIILKEESKRIETKTFFADESYKKYQSVGIDRQWYSNHLIEFVKNNFDIFEELLREKFTKKKVLKDLKKVIVALQKDINNVFDYTKVNDESKYGIAKICKDWFENSKEKTDFQNIQKKLKISS